MKITLLRHAQSLANEAKRHQGTSDEWRDTSLSEKGKEQAKQVAQRLKVEEFDLIYSSPLKRAVETTKEVSMFHKRVRVIYDDKLREQEDKETSEVFIDRVREFFKLLNEQKEKKILIVSHGGVIVTLLALSTLSKEKGSKVARRYSHSIFNTSVSTIEKQGEHFMITQIMDISHSKKLRSKIKRHYRMVRAIPYKVSKFVKEDVHEMIDFGDCRHKTELLLKLLKKDHIKARRVIVIFDWKDLPIPQDILNILKSGTKQAHHTVALTLDDEEILVDTTWNKELEHVGFPITEHWEADCDTKQVTEGKLEFFREKDFHKEDHELNTNKEELYPFAERLNDYLNKAYEEYYKKNKS